MVEYRIEPDAVTGVARRLAPVVRASLGLEVRIGRGCGVGVGVGVEVGWLGYQGQRARTRAIELGPQSRAPRPRRRTEGRVRWVRARWKG